MHVIINLCQLLTLLEDELPKRVYGLHRNQRRTSASSQTNSRTVDYHDSSYNDHTT